MTIGHVLDITGGVSTPNRSPGTTSEDGRVVKKRPSDQMQKISRETRNQKVEKESPDKNTRKTSKHASAINIKKIVAEINALMEAQRRNISFHLDQKADTMVILVKKVQTGEVVRQIPAQEILNLRTRFREMTGGLMDHIA